MCHSCVLAGLRLAPLVFNDFPCHTPPHPIAQHPHASSVMSPPATSRVKTACLWNVLSRVLEVSACRASQARRERVPASQPQLGQWDFYFWPGSAGSLSPTLCLGWALV